MRGPGEGWFRRLFEMFPPSQGAHSLLPQAPRRLPRLPPATVAGLLLVGASLQVPQDPVAEDQFLEEADGTLHAAIADGHLQGAVTRRTLACRWAAVCILSTAEAHESSPARSRPGPKGLQPGKEKTP